MNNKIYSLQKKTIKNTKKVVFFCLNFAKVLKIQARGEKMKAKQIIGSIVFVGLFFVVILFCAPIQNASSLSADDYLRIHIRANSNSSADQKVKYEIKDEVVKVLTPLLSEAKTKQQAVNIINENLDLVCTTADAVLGKNGFKYTSSASIKSEYFPTRTYEDLTLESDIYDALIINLGSGSGDNWWCVAYPPMCFVQATDTSSEGVVYKSKLVEIIKNFFNL